MIAILCLCVSGYLLIYTFAGYPALLWLRSRLRPRPVGKGKSQPTVTVLIAAHNEERVIKRKLDSIFSSNYPPNKLDVIVLSDGSSDATNTILFAYNDSRVSTMLLEGRIGKAAALNIGMRQASGEVVVFTDARQVLEKNCLGELVANFADPSVGCVSGQLMIGNISGATEFSGEQMKWKLENAIRNWEGMAGSCIGALGAFYGARRSLLVDIPAGTLLDDCYLPLHIVRQGYRTVFELDARVWDDVITTPAQEFRRKVRTLTGNYQLLRLAPWLLSNSNPVRWEFVSHKLCRLLIPFLLAAVLVGSLFGPSLAYKLFGAVQIGAYLLGGLAIIWRRVGAFRVAEIARAVIVLNAATLMAFLNFVTGNFSVWTRDLVTPADAPPAQVKEGAH
jgi:cellulose synthase/poly-beta-1,6-N-acetylglucosamine synthase-like glycosyltransferase